MEKGMQNNQMHTRYDLVTLQKGKMVLVSKVEIIDISLGGVALRADRQLDLNREYMLRLAYADHSVNVKGTIVRSSISGTDTDARGEEVPAYTVGMKFMDNQTDKIAAFFAAVELRKKDEVSPAADRRLHARFQIVGPQKK